MAKVPQEIIVQSRIERGTMPERAQGSYVRAPRQVQAPMLQPRSVKAPFQDALVDKVGPVVTRQAISYFGDILVDTSAKLADKKAKLIAESIYNRTFYAISEASTNPDRDNLGYLLKKGGAAVVDHGLYQEQVFKIIGDAANSAPNHAKTYLIPMLNGLQRRTLAVAADHKRKQYGVWDQQVEQDKMARFEQELKDLTKYPAKETLGHIRYAADNMVFGSELERQTFIDKGVATSLTYSAAQVVVPGEDRSSKLPMLMRIEQLTKRVHTMNDFVSPEQAARNLTMLQYANSQVVAEMKRWDAAAKRELSEEHDRLMDIYFGYILAGTPIPIEYLEQGRVSGAISNKEFFQIRGLMEQEIGSAESFYAKETEGGLLLEFDDLLLSEASPGKLMNFITMNYYKQNLTKDDFNSMRSLARNKANSDYMFYYRQLRDAGIRLIMPEGIVPGLTTQLDNSKLTQYLNRAVSALDKLNADGTMTLKSVLQLEYELERSYPDEKDLEQLAPFPFDAPPNVRSPRSLEDLDRAKMRMLEVKDTKSEIDKMGMQFLFSRYEFYIKRRIKDMQDRPKTNREINYRGN